MSMNRKPNGLNLRIIPVYFVLSGFVISCGSGSSPAPNVLEDPVDPVIVDTTISGNFEGTDTGQVPDDILPEVLIDFSYGDEFTNSLSDADIARAPDFTYEAFVLAFEGVGNDFPDLDTSSDAYANSIIDRIEVNPQGGARSERGIFDQFNNLTDAEKQLVLKNPLKAYRSKKAADDALAATGSLFTGSKYLTRADAFRHAYWNWLMSECCSVKWAKAFATAHESETPNNDDRRMDLNNNIIGRRLYSSGTTSASDAQSSLLDYNLLWINSTTKNVTVGVDYLVYLEPKQSMKVFDDGPEFDDIYTISIDGNELGDTPEGGSRDFNFNQIPSGDYPLSIFCKLDGTMGGCGFEIILTGASILSTGMQQTPQIVIQESETHTDTLTFPTMNSARTN